jgi:hypothetical protein
MTAPTNISFQGFADICTQEEIAAAESKTRSPGFPSLTCGEVDEIIDLLVNTYDFHGNETVALQDWLDDNNHRLPSHQIYNLLVLGRTAWEDIRREAAAAAND